MPHGYQDEPSLTTLTSATLLAELRAPENRTVWQQYVDRYRPVIVGYARRRGLSDDDAQDAAQETLMLFSRAYVDGKYEREKGRLRKWLLAIAHNQISNAFRRRNKHEVQVVDKPEETAFFARIDDEKASEDVWEQEWRQGVLQACLEEVRLQVDAKTMQAFVETSVSGTPAGKVAERLGITRNAVYLARHHVLKRVRELIPKMEEIW